jgi:hypothetical protein
MPEYVARLESAADVMTRALAGRVRKSLAGEEGAEKLASFIEKDLRDDLVAVMSAPRKSEFSWFFQLAEERGYVSTELVPRLSRESSRWQVIWELVARRMGRKLDAGLRRRLEDSLGSLGEAPLHEEVGLTEEQFDQRTEFLPRLFGNPWPEVEYRLVLPEGAETVDLDVEIAEYDDHLAMTTELDGRPTPVFAVMWACPDAAWQQRRFGRIALTGNELQEYIIWEASLPPGHRSLWLASLERIDPGRDLEPQLRSIRLPPIEGEGSEDQDLDRGVELILD